MGKGLRFFAALLAVLMIIPAAGAAPLESGEPVSLTSPAVVLAEASTGTVIFEKNADEKRQVASITKLMTALLLLEDINNGTISLSDQVVISPNAAAAKGSQALLDAGATYPMETLMQAMIMASANDAAISLAEHASGTEAVFVDRMNARAAELGMANTRYVNCTGLPQEGQYTTARDVMILSCEMGKHPSYHKYASVWIDTLKHPSGRVTDLTNTNRLVRFYEGCDGFKTGSTDEAKFCVSATAEKNGMRLVAVVLGNPKSQTRFDEARAMLDYGFATYRRITIAREGDLLGQQVPVTRGSRDMVDTALGSGLSMLLRSGQEKQLAMEVELPESVQAPVLKGDTLGTVRILLDGKVVAKLNCVAAQDVRLPGFLEGFIKILDTWR